MEIIERIGKNIVEKSLEYAPSVMLAIIALVVGLWLIHWAKKAFSHLLEVRKVDITLRPFLSSAVAILMKVGLLLSIASTVGLQVSSFLTILGGAGLAIGLALQGSLSNLAGGVLILVLRPFKVGDLVHAQGHLGFVHTIHLFNTTLKTKEMRTVILPNGPLAASTIVNFSTEEYIRVETSIGISYADDIDRARAIMLSEAAKIEGVAQAPAPAVFVQSLADSSVLMLIRVWVSYRDESNVPFFLNENIKKAFDREGITIPFPQRVVHLPGKDTL